MPLETGTFVNSLNVANPAPTDPKSEGDDHLRLVKSTIKNSFPNITGEVTATQTELNYTDGVTSNIQTQINNLDTEVNITNITPEGLYEHSHTINSNYTIAVGNNALAAGPLNIASGVSVTIPTGSTFVIA